MATTEKVHILGIGDDGLEGLTSAARQLLQAADLIVGPEHSLTMLHGLKAKQSPVGGPRRTARG